jgi:hypothetical protein
MEVLYFFLVCLFLFFFFFFFRRKALQDKAKDKEVLSA